MDLEAILAAAVAALPALLTLYWALATGAALAALLPLPFASGFRCAAPPPLAARRRR
jgi:hypothetical protein